MTHWLRNHVMDTNSSLTRWNQLRDKAQLGTFDPNRYNWAVGENRIPVPDDTTDIGVRYETRVCIYVMGDGGSQLIEEFPLVGPPSAGQWDLAESLIRTTFPTVTRVIRGVG